MKNFKNLLLYIAGYIDGDGCIYIGTFKQKTITVYEFSLQIVSVKEPVLHVFKNAFGGVIRKKPIKEKHRDAYCWTIKGPGAIQLITQVTNYVVEKKYQCQLFIKFTKTIKQNNFKTITNAIIDKRNELINQIREEKHMNNHVTKEIIEQLKNEKFTITPTEADYPYLAGLIDSEGCFRIRKWKPKNKPNDVYCIGLEIGNAKLPIIPWLVKRFGGGITFSEAKGAKKAFATWNIAATSLYKILPKIRPFLKSKKEVCDLLIEFQQTILPNGGDRHSELFKALFEKRIEVRERIVAKVHQFNHKGSI